jgi:hypothetical protein
MGNPVEIKSLFFALVRGSPGAEIIFLNQNLAIRSSSALRDFNAYFLGTLSHRLFDFVHETRDCLRLVEFYDDMLDGVGARANPTGGPRAGMSVEQVLNRVIRVSDE